MKKHKLWGRKNPGPYTKLGNGLFDGTAAAAGKAGSVLSNGTAMAVGGAMVGASALGSGVSSAGQSVLDGAGNMNEWAQGLTDPDDGIRAYTLNDDLDGGSALDD